MIRKSGFFSRSTVSESTFPRLIFWAAIVAVFVASVFAFQPPTAVSRGDVMPTATPSPRKIRKIAVGDVNGDGMDPGIRKPASPAPTSRSRPIKRNQDIEVENDETHWVGHDRTRRVRTTNNSKANRSTPKTRTETVNHNENRSTNFFGNTDPSHSYGKSRVQRSTGNKTSSGKINRRVSPKRK